MKTNLYLIPSIVMINILWIIAFTFSYGSPNFFIVLQGPGAGGHSSDHTTTLAVGGTNNVAVLRRRTATITATTQQQQQHLRRDDDDATDSAPSSSTGKSKATRTTNDNNNGDEEIKFLLKFPGLPVCETLESANDVDVTLVTQTSRDRLHLMKDICKRWKGPISLVVADVWLDQKELVQRLDSLGCNNNLITAASVYNTDFSMEKYPVNILRNVALRQAKTSHAILIDIDLIPSKDLYNDILYHRELLRKNDKAAIVVPAFQLNPTTIPECRESVENLVSENCTKFLHSQLPETKTDLLKFYGHPFNEPQPPIHQFTGRDHYYGHSSTGYEAWIEQTPKSLEPIECLQSVRYEPYLVVRLCHDLPPYQEQFTGYGKNKVSWMWHIHRSGYNLLRLGSGFIIHYPHPKSSSKKHWRENKRILGRPNVDVERYATAFRAFLEKEIPYHDANTNDHDEQQVNNRRTTPFCDNFENTYGS